VLRDSTAAYRWGFIFLAIFALGCLAVNYFVFIKPCAADARGTGHDLN